MYFSFKHKHWQHQQHMWVTNVDTIFQAKRFHVPARFQHLCHESRQTTLLKWKIVQSFISFMTVASLSSEWCMLNETYNLVLVTNTYKNKNSCTLVASINVDSTNNICESQMLTQFFKQKDFMFPWGLNICVTNLTKLHC